jgi:hypothetical protein
MPKSTVSKVKKNKLEKIKLLLVSISLWFAGCHQAEIKTELSTAEKADSTAPNNSIQHNEIHQETQLNSLQIDSINRLIELFKELNLEKIAEKISFPLDRQYPIPSIKNKEEFKLRFSEVFDEILVKQIATSNIEQWSEVGWRGIMLNNGEVWMAHAEGTITDVNYQSEFEKELLKSLLEKEKENLHISLKSFENPTYKIKTKNYLIRIDELANAKYRYASWKLNENESSKPDIIIENGEIESSGSGGNHFFTFVNGIFTYKIYRNVMGENNPPDITLEVEKEGKAILTEHGKINRP